MLPAAGADQLPGLCIRTGVVLKMCTNTAFKAKPPHRLGLKSLNFDRSLVPATWGYQSRFLFVCCGFSAQLHLCAHLA